MRRSKSLAIEDIMAFVERTRSDLDSPVLANPRLTRANVLLVDDEPGRLLSYEAILGDLDVSCIKANSGAEALEHLLKFEFAVMILDIHMPGMNGFEVARMVAAAPTA
jgi:CheY-like chemotaxis protein